MSKPIEVNENSKKKLMRKLVREFVLPKLLETKKKFPGRSTPVVLTLGGAYDERDMWYACKAGRNTKVMTYTQTIEVPSYVRGLFLLLDKNPTMYANYMVRSGWKLWRIKFEYEGYYPNGNSLSLRKWKFVLLEDD
ncbi:MAG: hypothetical protein FWF46_02870 [Oscillospiraceae bacterium]|nr:hypothetical protein [Oscillospiraceae bacterium]